jgi:hypothetical protein
MLFCANFSDAKRVVQTRTVFTKTAVDLRASRRKLELKAHKAYNGAFRAVAAGIRMLLASAIVHVKVLWDLLFFNSSVKRPKMAVPEGETKAVADLHMGLNAWQDMGGGRLYCPECGAAISDEAAYCKNCGAKVAMGEADAVGWERANDAPVEPAAIKRNIRAVNGDSSRRLRRKRKKGHAGLAFLIFLIIAAGAVFAFLQYQNTQQSQRLDVADITAVLRQYETRMSSMDSNEALKFCTPELISEFQESEGSSVIFAMLPDASEVSDAAKMVAGLTFSYKLEFSPEDIKLDRDSAKVSARSSWSVKLVFNIEAKDSDVLFNLKRVDGGWLIDSVQLVELGA